MWLLFMVVHLVGLVGFSLLLRHSLKQKIDQFTMATLMATAVALPLVFVIFFRSIDISAYHTKAVIYMVVQVILIIAFHVTNVKTLQYLEASVSSVISNLRIILITILGILFVGEKFIPLQVLGGLLIFLAVLIVRQKGSKKITGLGVRWGIVSAVVISFVSMFEKILIRDIGYINYAAPVMLISAVIMWVILLGRTKRVDIRPFVTREMGSLMIFRAMSAFGMQLALAAGAAVSLVVYISSLSTILVVIFGIILLGERDYLKQKLIATGWAVLGLSVILFAHLK